VIPLIPGITCLEAAMMGRLNSDQGSLFYAFRLQTKQNRSYNRAGVSHIRTSHR
jgi:hypothetical protein